MSTTRRVRGHRQQAMPKSAGHASRQASIVMAVIESAAQLRSAVTTAEATLATQPTAAARHLLDAVEGARRALSELLSP